MIPFATYKLPDVDGGKLLSTAAGTVNCPDETGALHVKLTKISEPFAKELGTWTEEYPKM